MSANVPFDLKQVLEHHRHYLPTQAPLKDFIHHNTLHAFQDRPFEQAVREASALYGAAINMPLQTYAGFLKNEKIDSDLLKKVLEKRVKNEDLREKYIKKIEWLKSQKLNLSDPQFKAKPKNPKSQKLRAHFTEVLGEELGALANPLLFRMISQFLDQGISEWIMPGAESLSFYRCVRELAAGSWPSLPPLTDGVCKKLLSLEPEGALMSALEQLSPHPETWEEYLKEAMFEHPGWSGLVSMIEMDPGLLIKKRSITLVEFLAVKLILEVGTIARQSKSKEIKIAGPLRKETVRSKSEPSLEELLQEALEETYYARLTRSILNHKPENPPQVISAQAFFCLDDRECSLRRHLESVDPTIETFGTAGFYGIDAMVLKQGRIFPVKSCPAPVQPKHLIYESAPSITAEKKHKRSHKLMRGMHGSTSKTLFTGMLQVPVMGIKASIRMVLDVLNPLAHERAFALDKLPPTGPIHIQKQEQGTLDSKYQIGYSIEEMTTRVAGVLKAVGLTSQFAPLIVLIAHGSSSVNNPYYAAYDCGACSGNPGSPNARAFAAMANVSEVRQQLKSNHGIHIPDSTYFIGGLHDTCRDNVEIFDIDTAPIETKKQIADFRVAVEEALGRNALERSQRFDLIPKKLTASQARKAVHDRALSIFEPRPELNHATNAGCVVGRRGLTRGLFMDRRVFLQSYDPASDADGKILANILSAVVPVCGGINLEYYFSRLDPNVYGAGTKLPHNVVSLLGVMNGAEGDILTGLPTQMTEVHDPVRLLLIIEQKPEVVEAVMQKHPSIADWIIKNWMHLVVLDASSSKKKMYRYQQGHFSPMHEEMVS